MISQFNFTCLIYVGHMVKYRREEPFTNTLLKRSIKKKVFTRVLHRMHLISFKYLRKVLERRAETEQLCPTRDLFSLHLVGLLKPNPHPPLPQDLKFKNKIKVAPIWKQHSKIVCSNQNESHPKRRQKQAPRLQDPPCPFVQPPELRV